MPVELHRLRSDDLPRLAATQGGAAWKGHDDKRWNRYLTEQSQGLRDVLLADAGDAIVAYGSLAWVSQNPSFRNAAIPEIQDLVVAEAHRGLGHATQMIATFEAEAHAAGCRTIGIGVGLYADYGSAQRLYVRLGYRPDGCGVTYENKPAIPGQAYRLDDGLVLWLTKPLP